MSPTLQFRDAKQRTPVYKRYRFHRGPICLSATVLLVLPFIAVKLLTDQLKGSIEPSADSIDIDKRNAVPAFAAIFHRSRRFATKIFLSPAETSMGQLETYYRRTIRVYNPSSLQRGERETEREREREIVRTFVPAIIVCISMREFHL